MARTLEELQKQYNNHASRGEGGRRGAGFGGGHRPRGPRPTGKPKNTKYTILRLFSYIKKHTGLLVLVILCMLGATVSSLCGAYLLSPIINKLALFINPDMHLEPSVFESFADYVISSLAGTLAPVFSFAGGGAAEVLIYVISAVIILAFVYALGLICTYTQARIMLSVSQGAIEDIRRDLFDKMQSLPVKYYDSHPTGELMSRYTNDVDNIGVMLDNSLISLISGSISLVGTFVFMITTNWILTLVTAVFIPIFVWGGAAIAKHSHKFYSGQQAALGAVNGYIEETVTGQKVVKVFNHEDECTEEFDTLNGDLREKQFKAQFWGGVMGPIMHNTSMISYAATIGVGGVLMCTSGFTPGALTLFAGYSKQFSFPINNISMQMSTVFSALAGAERVFGVMDAEPEAPDRDESTADTETLVGHVELEHVYFGYTPERTILKDISLYAKPGQKIAFVGSTGAGKTTVTNLLNRFYEIQEGEIRIDGRNIQSIPRDILRKNIATVLQDTHLFSGTVMENIRYGRLDATDEEVIEAAKTASAHSFIMRLSDGYNTVIEGDGANLSQGQRQLLNIARAAISKAPILVLDEATSSVDTRTERHIEHGMDRLMKDRTTFVIAHRLSTVRRANAIMVLETGEIIERGTHEELLALGGRYYELYMGKKELD